MMQPITTPAKITIPQPMQASFSGEFALIHTDAAKPPTTEAIQAKMARAAEPLTYPLLLSRRSHRSRLIVRHLLGS